MIVTVTMAGTMRMRDSDSECDNESDRNCDSDRDHEIENEDNYGESKQVSDRDSESDALTQIFFRTIEPSDYRDAWHLAGLSSRQVS